MKIKLSAVISALVLCASIPALSPSAHADPACSGDYVGGFLGMSSTNLGVQQKDGNYLFHGFLNSTSASLTLSTGDSPRLRGWLDSAPVSVGIRVKGNEVRLSGQLGTSELMSVLIERKSPTELRIGGFGPHGFVSLTLFSKDQPSVLIGNLNNRSIRLELTQDDGALSLRGDLGNEGNEFVEFGVDTCLDSTLNYGPVTASQLFALITLLAG